MVSKKKQGKSGKLPPLVTVQGNGLTKKFKAASWDLIRDEFHQGRGRQRL
jgi:hypothetical protein